uniref:uncharacterized protein LOC120339500 n=1 Tax=Styela clava TaxID=7725 RepID=UPI001939E048|nr:uncharacterized protein LOC120339500 [Styela clava]
MRFYMITSIVAFAFGFLMAIQGDSGACITRIINGRFVTQGHCEKPDGEDIVDQLRRRVNAAKERETCPIYYNGKCIWPIKVGEKTTNFASAISVCTNIGRKLADITSKKQYNLIASYMEPWLDEDSNRNLYIWTGMKYSSKIKNLTYIDGTKPNWLLKYPNLPAKEKNVGVVIGISDAHEFIDYRYWNKVGFGALCQ